MNLSRVSISNIRHRPLSSLLSVILLAFGIGIIILLTGISDQLDKQFTRNISGIDMVVGAKGSPMQLILSSVYQIDDPTGNISLKEFNDLKKNRLVKEAIPLAYGDNYQGYRIVGTEKTYPEHYSAALASGKWWDKTGEVVLGARVAELTDLRTGEEFAGSHGLTQSIDRHDHLLYKVVGIMQPTGTVVDKLILTNIESVWAVHEDHGEEMAAEPGEHDDHHHETETAESDSLHEHTEDREITAGLIKFANPMATLTLPRMVNQQTNMQAALPAIEVNRLFSLMGSGVKTLRILAILIVALSAISVFISLYQSLKERKFELALLRSLGAGSLQLFYIVLLEGLIISLLGYIIGLLGGKLALYFVGILAEENYQYSFGLTFKAIDFILLPLTLAIGIIAALIPAIRAYRINISKVLSDA